MSWQVVVRQGFWALLLAGCAIVRPATPPPVVEAQADEPLDGGEWDRETPRLVEAVETVEPGDEGAAALPEFLRQFSPSLSPSLLGTVEARVPGVPGSKLEARLGRVRVVAKVDHGFVYTEVEGELVNDANVPVEVVASFRAPPSGVIARMGLWVDERLIDAEVVERKRTASSWGSGSAKALRRSATSRSRSNLPGSRRSN